MQEPKISVCLITYNQEAYISKALESVLSQKTKYNFEFIIGEDGSSDGTSDICRKYAKDFPDTIKLIERDRNCPERKKYSCQSLYNFIHTIKEAQGKYVMIIEGDDYWTAPYKLQKQVDFMEANPDFTMCVHPAEVKYESCDWTQEQIKDLDSTVPPTNLHNLFCTNNEIPLKYMLQSNCIATASAMYRWKYYGEEFQKAFPLHIMPGDWYLHLLHARDGKIGYLPDSMSVYRKHSGGIYSSLGKDMGYFYDKFGMLELNFYHAVMQLFPKILMLLPLSAILMKIMFFPWLKPC